MELEGLTGEIRFSEDGRRTNYTLHVMEMTVNSAMVKVSAPLAAYICPLRDEKLKCKQPRRKINTLFLCDIAGGRVDRREGIHTCGC